MAIIRAPTLWYSPLVKNGKQSDRSTFQWPGAISKEWEICMKLHHANMKNANSHCCEKAEKVGNVKITFPISKWSSRFVPSSEFSFVPEFFSDLFFLPSFIRLQNEQIPHFSPQTEDAAGMGKAENLVNKCGFDKKSGKKTCSHPALSYHTRLLSEKHEW